MDVQDTRCRCLDCQTRRDASLGLRVLAAGWFEFSMAGIVALGWLLWN